MDEPLRIVSYPAYERAERNPYNALLCSELAALGHVVEEFWRRRLRKEPWDVLHIHWPEFLIDRSSRLNLWKSIRIQLALIDRVRERGTRLVWTVHDLGPHERLFPREEAAFWSDFIDRVDGVIGLSHATLAAAIERWPRLNSVPSFVVAHGHYREVYPQSFGRSEARRKLDMDDDATVIAWLGQIRPYKNVPALIEAFRALDDPKIVLSICGRPLDESMADLVRTAAEGDPRIRLRLRFLQNFEITRQLIAADMLALPYGSILNSGSALLGLSLDRPILVPALGAMPELQESIGTEWVRTYDGAFTADVLHAAIDWARSTPRPAVAPLDALDWSTIAQQTVCAYNDVCGRDRRN